MKQIVHPRELSDLEGIRLKACLIYGGVLFGLVSVKGVLLLCERRFMTEPVTSLHRQMRNPLKSQLLHDFVSAVLDVSSVTSSPTQELTAVVCVTALSKKSRNVLSVEACLNVCLWELQSVLK